MSSSVQTRHMDARQTQTEHYDGFDSMLIAGRWRQGRSEQRIEDVDPYRGDTFLTRHPALTRCPFPHAPRAAGEGGGER